MHSYSIDGNERRDVALLLGASAVGLGFLVNLLVRSADVDAAWWIPVPSAFGLGAAAYLLVDRYLWRWAPARRVLRISTPNLEGKWTGSLASTYKGATDPIDVEVTVKQRWTALVVTLATQQSRSFSSHASLQVNNPFGPTLTYGFSNQPLPNATDSMHSHQGTAILSLSEMNSLNGEYYTARDRQTQGTIQLQKVM